ncbi:MAG: S4 domain-containing protein [Sterolibacterium sp.]|jgi:ribosome-associated heat shock protein Hsp15
MTCQRIDKWLWAARFFKTRSLASAAITGGKVRLDGQATKPAKEIRHGDTLDIDCGDLRRTVVVMGTNERRRPADEAHRLYAETPQSLARRQLARELRKLSPVPGANLRGRPTKKAGRQIRRISDPD